MRAVRPNLRKRGIARDRRLALWFASVPETRSTARLRDAEIRRYRGGDRGRLDLEYGVVTRTIDRLGRPVAAAARVAIRTRQAQPRLETKTAPTGTAFALFALLGSHHAHRTRLGRILADREGSGK